MSIATDMKHGYHPMANSAKAYKLCLHVLVYVLATLPLMAAVTAFANKH